MRVFHPIFSLPTALFISLFIILATLQTHVYAMPVVDQQQPSINPSAAGLLIGGINNQSLAQTVTTGISGQLREVLLPVEGSGDELLIEIQAVSTGKPNGVVLASQSFSAATLPPFFHQTRG